MDENASLTTVFTMDIFDLFTKFHNKSKFHDFWDSF